MGDVSKGAACIKMATAKLGWDRWVGEIVLRRSRLTLGDRLKSF